MSANRSNRMNSNRSCKTSNVSLDIASKSVDERLDEISNLLSSLITEDMLDRKLSKLKDELSKQNKEKIEHLEKKVRDLEVENDDLRQTVNKLDEQMSEIQYNFPFLPNKVNDLEQQGRKNSIRILGLADPTANETTETCIENVVHFFQTLYKFL